MNLLAFDSSTETLSIAVQRAGASALAWTGAGGAQASAQIIGQIQSLLAQAGLRLDELQAIAFGAGPGSFTGLRTACAVAQGLGFAANVPLLPLDTLLAVAEDARQGRDTLDVVAALDARMDEIYLGRYQYQSGQWRTVQAPHLTRAQGLEVPGGACLAGNIGALCPQPVHAALPQAEAMLRLAPALLAQGAAVAAEHAMPHYVRNKVAQTSAERAALRVAKVPP